MLSGTADPFCLRTCHSHVPCIVGPYNSRGAAHLERASFLRYCSIHKGMSPHTCDPTCCPQARWVRRRGKRIPKVHHLAGIDEVVATPGVNERFGYPRHARA